MPRPSRSFVWRLAAVRRVRRCALVTAFAPRAALAQPETPLLVPRLSAPLVLDGRTDDNAWQQIQRIPLVPFPHSGDAAIARAFVRLAHDDLALYVAGDFLVDAAADVRATSLTRDQVSADDLFRINLDTFHDRLTGVGFGVTPAGTQLDYTIAGDGATINTGWNASWSAATRRDAAGWHVELRIPLSLLRFQRSGDLVVMGVLLSRFSAATNELSTYPALSASYANAPLRPSLAAPMEMRSIAAPRSATVTPYLASRVQLTATPAATVGGDNGVTWDVGGDARIRPGSNITVDITANTDFGESEVDDERVNLTRFSILYPDKRQFFQERASTFAVALDGGGDPSTLFHSRRIGLTTDGLPLRVYGGGRLVGRYDRWDVGALALMTARNSGGSERFAVVRLQRSAGTRSTVGGMLTVRDPTDGSARGAWAVDARLAASPRDFLVLQWAGSDNSGASVSSRDAMLARVAVERPGTMTTRGLSYQAGVKWSGAAFDPPLGFQPRRDYSHLYADLRFGWYPQRARVPRVLQPAITGGIYRDNPSGVEDSRYLGSFLNFEYASGWRGWLGVDMNEEVLAEPLHLSPIAVVPAGDYSFGTLEAYLLPPDGRRLRVGIGIIAGHEYDGRHLAADIAPEWVVSEHLQLSATYNPSRTWFDRRDEAFPADVFRLRANLSLDQRLSLTALMQYNRATSASAPFLRLRQHIGEGRDLFITYRARSTTGTRSLPGVPAPPDGRALQAKLAFMFGQ